ncbi:MAG: glycosyltransferase family 4 protein [Magnetospirillum sp.]|nr:glycosyltransferase family 4 protein [Magnetospirillum sp.]
MSNLLLFNLRTDADDDVLGFTTAWINALARRFDNVHVITMSAGRLAVAANVTVHSLGREKGYSEFRRALIFYRLLWSVLRSGRIDACFAHMNPLFVLMGWPLLAAWRVPVVLWYAHGTVSRVARWCIPLVRTVVTSSSSGFPVATPKRQVIGQGIDTEVFRPDPGDDGGREAFTVLAVGRLSPVKRLDLTLRAVALVRPHVAALRVVIVGGPASDKDEAEVRRLHALAEQLGLADAVEFRGKMPFPQVRATYALADVYVNTSETGSMDKTVLEAMSMGVPALTSNPAFGDALLGELGRQVLVAHGDVDALAARLRQLAEMSPQARRELGRRQREMVVADHGLDALAAKITAQLNHAAAEVG